MTSNYITAFTKMIVIVAKKYHKNMRDMRVITERMHSDDMLCNPVRALLLGLDILVQRW